MRNCFDHLQIHVDSDSSWANVSFKVLHLSLSLSNDFVFSDQSWDFFAAKFSPGSTLGQVWQRYAVVYCSEVSAFWYQTFVYIDIK